MQCAVYHTSCMYSTCFAYQYRGQYPIVREKSAYNRNLKSSHREDEIESEVSARFTGDLFATSLGREVDLIVAPIAMRYIVNAECRIAGRELERWRRSETCQQTCIKTLNSERVRTRARETEQSVA